MCGENGTTVQRRVNRFAEGALREGERSGRARTPDEKD